MSEARSMDEIVGMNRAKFQRDETTFEWNAFAKEAKRAANYSCQICKRGGPAIQLAVHHPFYEVGRRKWEYKLSDVQVLCQPCHEDMHEALQAFRRYVFSRMTPRGLQVLNGALVVGLSRFDAGTLARAVASLVSAPSALQRFADEWRDETTIDAKRNG